MERYKIKNFEIILVDNHVIIKTALQISTLVVHSNNQKLFLDRVIKATKRGKIEDMADLFKLFFKKSGEKEQVIFMQPFNRNYYEWGKDL